MTQIFGRRKCFVTTVVSLLEETELLMPNKSTYSLLVVAVHEVLVPSPEIWHTLELGHSQEVGAPPATSLQVGLGFHIVQRCGQRETEGNDVHWSHNSYWAQWDWLMLFVHYQSCVKNMYSYMSSSRYMAHCIIKLSCTQIAGCIVIFI